MHWRQGTLKLITFGSEGLTCSFDRHITRAEVYFPYPEHSPTARLFAVASDTSIVARDSGESASVRGLCWYAFYSLLPRTESCTRRILCKSSAWDVTRVAPATRWNPSDICQYSIVRTLATEGMMGRTARRTGKHRARCAYISWSFCWSCINYSTPVRTIVTFIVGYIRNSWRTRTGWYKEYFKITKKNYKSGRERSQTAVFLLARGLNKVNSNLVSRPLDVLLRVRYPRVWVRDWLNSHERKHCACDQEDDADHFAWSAVAVLAVATIHVAFGQPWRFAGISALLGGVTSPDVRLTNAFRVHLAAPISTGRACYGLLVLVAMFPRFGASALVALQCIGYEKKKKKKQGETCGGTPAYSQPLITATLPFHSQD